MLRRTAWLGLVAISVAAGTGVAVANDPSDADPRPWLGISYGPDGDLGIRVTNVFEESGALACGLRVGDEIVEIDGQPTPPRSNLAPLIELRAIGERLTMRVFRDNRLVTLKPVLSRRMTDAELLHVQLVGKRAPSFSLIRPVTEVRVLAKNGTGGITVVEAGGDVIADSVLNGKVGVLAWFHIACSSCPAVVNRLAPWVDGHRGAVGAVGLGGPAMNTTAQLVDAAMAILSSRPVMLPVGVDQEAWLKFGVLEDVQNKVSVVIVDRNGVVVMAAAIDASTEDPSLDDVFAAAELALAPRKPRR